MLNVLLVDDRPEDISVLKRYLNSFSNINIVGECNNGEDAIHFLREHHEVDLIFLDIEMDGITGLEVAKHVQSMYSDLFIIFTTGHAGFALESYEVHPLDFLTKPIDFLRLEQALSKANELKNKSLVKVPQPKIGIKVDHGIKIIDVNDIIYIEKKGRSIFIQCKGNESFRSGDTMQNLESIFSPYDFYRSHQSFLVPIDQLQAIYPDTFSRSYIIELKDGNVKIPLSRTRYNALKELLERKGIPLL